MRTIKYLVFALIAALISTLAPKNVSGQIEKCFPKQELKLVYDVADALSEQEEQSLESLLQSFEKQTSNQFVVVIVNDLCDYDKADYAIELGDTWGVGQKELSNGVVILVKPKRGTERGEVFIAIGRGLEGAIPDAATWTIIDNEMIPSFKNNDYAGGINNATTVLMALAKGEYNYENYKGDVKKKNLIGGGIVFLLIVILMVFIISYKVKEARAYARLNHMDFWLAWQLLNQMQGRNRSGGFGGGFRGGSGGFGGFGGGGFGGGGAGGSW